jgi:DHA1 family tetracycline resistance protein-like MFS transporter
VNTSRILPLMALTVLIDMAGFALALPMLPFWAQEFGADATAIGMMMAAYSIAQFVFTPIVGALSDRFGRRPTIVGALILEGLGLIGTALSGSVPMLIATRFISGIGGSSIGSAQAVVADVTDESNRARGMGFIGAAIGIGFVVGPAAGALLSLLGPSAPFWGSAAVVLADAVLVALILPETVALRRPQAHTGGPSPLRIPDVRRLIVITLLFTTAFAAMETVLPLFTQATLGWGAAANGAAFALVGIVMVIIQGGLIGRLVKLAGERRLLFAGLVLVTGGLAVLPLGGLLATIILGAGMTTLGMALIYPTSSSLLTYAAPPDRAGVTLGLARGAGGVARVIGPAIAGLLYTGFSPAAPFLVAAVISAGSVLLVPLPFGGRRAAHAAAAVVAAADPERR